MLTIFIQTPIHHDIYIYYAMDGTISYAAESWHFKEHIEKIRPFP